MNRHERRRSAKQARRPVAKGEESDGVCFRVDGEVWSWLDQPRMFLRMKDGAVPDDFVNPVEPMDETFLRTAKAEKPRGPALPVEGDTIGGLKVSSASLLAGVVEIHGEVTWTSWQSWFVARDAAGDVVAVWKMQDGTHMLNLRMVAFRGHVWACGEHLCFRFTAPPETMAKVRATMKEAPNVVAILEAAVAASSAGTVVPVRRESADADALVFIGSSRIPLDQLQLVEHMCGKELEWRWTAPTAPVLAWKGDEPLAMVMPVPVMAKGGEA